jgi:hypothetical protein
MLQSGSPPGGGVRSTRGVFATLLCAFLILRAFWRFWVTRRRPRILASGVLEHRSVVLSPNRA